MLDIRRIRQNPEEVKAGLERRHANADIDGLLAKDEERRNLLLEVEQKKAKRNADSKKIPQMKKAGEDTTELMAEMKQLADDIKELDDKCTALDNEITEMLLAIPNVPHETTPDGLDDRDNVEVRRFMEPTKFDFEPKPHWEIGEEKNILDPETGASVTGARFTFYRGLGARLERSVMNFMLDLHTMKHGYTEVFPPFMVHEHSMYGTGQLPKFREDMYHLEGTDYYLIPTAEVPVTNMYRNCVLDGADLPILHTAYSACFRGEAGSAGRDTRGLIRQHQFNKVELVKFARPDNSFEELEKLTADAEDVLKLLKIPYRVVSLCAGDIGFSSCKTYDIEVWMPSYNRYVEISSCSNFMDYQARRANIRFRDGKGKPEYVHTLNGSGLAIGRTTAAILENYQRADGSIEIPEVLRKYMGVDEIK